MSSESQESALKELETARQAETRQVCGWLTRFAKCVRDRDFGSANDLFDSGVLGFGSIAGRCDGVQSLRLAQWEKIWPITSNFNIHEEGMRIEVAGELAWVGATWSSVGHSPEDAPFKRAGRATLILRKGLSGSWRAVHSHFSLMPGSLHHNSDGA